MLMVGVGAQPGFAQYSATEDFYEGPAKRLPTSKFDVVVAGAGRAADFCADKNRPKRELPYATLRRALEKGSVYFES
jgi:hypothetical protein